MAFLGIPTSRKDVGNAGWLKGAATVGARTLANVGSITGGSGGSVAKLRGFADAVDDPNKGYAGTLNPLKAVSSINAPGTAFNFTSAARAAAPGGGGGGGGNNGQVPGAETGAYGNGPGGSYDPDTYPTKVANQRNNIRNLLSIFASAYEDVVSKVDALAADKRASLTKNYDDQQAGLDKNYGTTTQGIDDQFSARNAYHSSYRENAQQQAKDAYDTATTQLGQSEANDLAGVGQFADQQKAELSASRPTFNPDDYGSVSDLLSIGQDVQAAINKLGTTGAGLGTTSQYMAILS